MDVLADRSSSVIHYEGVKQARDCFSGILDAAEQGRMSLVSRRGQTAAVVDAGRLRYMLSQIIVPRGAQVIEEGGCWTAFLPGLPLAAEEATFDEAIDELIEAMREYAEDWQQRLSSAPNHRENWGLVKFVELADDQQLREWLLTSEE